MAQKQKKYLIFVIAVAVLAVLIGWIIWGNQALMVSHFTIVSPHLPEHFSGFRIAQISDLHNAEFGQDNQKLISMLKDTSPDLIVITGDLVDSRNTDIAIGISFALQAVQLAPTYYVTGNHEARIAEYDQLKAGLEEAGVTVLENEGTELRCGADTITLLGINDPSFLTGYLFGDSVAVTREALAGLVQEDSYTILLSHRPELFETYAECGVDLIFSGHAHGGQFRLPFIGGVAAPNQGLFPKYDAGCYTLDDTKMIVSRGIGNSIIPFRVNNRPEIVIADLQAGVEHG